MFSGELGIDGNSFSILFMTIILFLAVSPIRNAAVKFQRKSIMAHERNTFKLPYREEMTTLPFWVRSILFPWFMFSKKQFLKRTIFYRFWGLINTLIMILVCIMPLNVGIQGSVFVIHILITIALLIIFGQELRPNNLS